MRRLRRTITDTLSSEGLRALDRDRYPGIHRRLPFDTNRCMIAALKQSELDYVLLARLTPLAPSHNGSASKPEQQLVVSLGRTPAPASAWGPWRMSTTCLDCSDSDLADATQQLVVRAWKAMTKAETPPQNIKVTRQDRSDKGAKLLSAAHDENLSAFDQIYLLKKAIQAGAGRRAFLDLAQAFYDCQGYQEAEDYLAKAAAEGADVDFLLGPVLWFSGRWIDAQPVFERLALASPNDEQLQHALAEVRRRGQDYHGVLWQAEAELARGDAIQAIELGRIAPRLAEALGRIWCSARPPPPCTTMPVPWPNSWLSSTTTQTMPPPLRARKRLRSPSAGSESYGPHNDGDAGDSWPSTNFAPSLATGSSGSSSSAAR